MLTKYLFSASTGITMRRIRSALSPVRSIFKFVSEPRIRIGSPPLAASGGFSLVFNRSCYELSTI